MEFWNAFFSECLQSPWVIQHLKTSSPLDEAVPGPAISTPFAFLIQPGVDDAGYEMLSKMIQALKLPADQVTLIEVSDDDIENLRMVGEPKKLLFFGHSEPARVGQFRNWYGHQVMATHGISRLQEQPQLKKEAWWHLQKYAGLK